MRLARTTTCILLVIVFGCGEGSGGVDGSTGGDTALADLPALDQGPAGDSDLTVDHGLKDLFEPPPTCLLDLECDDSNPCTIDSCTDGKCDYAHGQGPCDDHDECTSNDSCSLGKCAGKPMDCDDGNTCTTDGCKDGACTHEAAEGPECALTVVITHPKRADTLWAGKDTSVSGVVSSPAGQVASATLNSAPLMLGQDGSFLVQYSPFIGINVLDATVTDSLGRTARTVQSFAFGQWIRPPGTPGSISAVGGATRVWLRADLFDDDAPDLDDMAALVSLVLGHLDVGAVIPHPLTAEGEEPGLGWCTWTVDVSNVSWNVGPVDIDTVPGGMLLSASLTGLSAYVEAVAPWCPDALGWVYADEVGIEARLDVAVASGGSLDVGLDWVDVTVSGVSVDLTGGVASLFDWVVNWFSGVFETKIEETLESWIPEKLLPMIAGVLEGFTDFETQFQVPPVPGNPPAQPLSLSVGASKAEFSAKGARMTLDSGVAASPVNGHVSPGSIAREDCQGKDPGPFLIPAKAMVEAAVHEDWLNQALFALWAGGHMNVTIDGETLGVSLADYGISDMLVTVDPFLPPVLTSCRSPGFLEVQVGDVNIKATFTMGGGTGGAELFGSVRVPVDVTLEQVTGGTEVGFAAKDFQDFGVDVVQTTGAVEGFDALFEDLLSTVAKNLLIEKVLPMASASYPVPVVDLHDFLDDLPAGSEVSFAPQTLEPSKGFLLFSGYVKAP